MGTNGNRTNNNMTSNKGSRNAKAKTAKKNRRSIIILIIELFILIVMGVILWFVTRTTDEEEGVKKVILNTEELQIDKQVEENEILDDYRTIALFGVDSTVGSLAKNTNSDTIMIASINKKTSEVKLMSVYRDTYLNLSNDTYSKCNKAYAQGGPKQAISMLNVNLDLNITDFVAVGFKGLMEAVDAVGGVYIDVTPAEIPHLNNYQKSIADNMKISYQDVTESGLIKLNGLQATAYCRIRYVGNNDFERTQRQRTVLLATLERAKRLSVSELTSIVNNVFGNVLTSIDVTEMISILGELSKIKVVDEGGFPELEDLTTGDIGAHGNCIVPYNLEESVREFHIKFFGVENYETSETLAEISSIINSDTSPYIR